MTTTQDEYLDKMASESKDLVHQQGDPERMDQKVTDKEHDAPVTAADIEFIESFNNSPAKSKLMRKMDFRLLPILILLYLVSFIGTALEGVPWLKDTQTNRLSRFRPEQHW